MVSHLSTFYIGFTCLCQTLWIFEADIWMFLQFVVLPCSGKMLQLDAIKISSGLTIQTNNVLPSFTRNTNWSQSSNSNGGCQWKDVYQPVLQKLLCSTQKVDVLLVGKIWTWFSALICATSSHLQNNLTTRWAVAETRVDSYCKNDLICSSFPEIHGVGNVGIFVQHNFWWK